MRDDAAAESRAGRRVVGQGQLERSNRGEGRPAEIAALPVASGAEQAALKALARAPEAGCEGAAGCVGGAGGGKGREIAPDSGAEALLEPVVQGAPPASADVDDPRAGRSDPAPAGEPGGGDAAAARAGETRQVNAVEGVAATAGNAKRVGAELPGPGVLIPIGVGGDPPTTLGDPVLLGPRFGGAEQQCGGRDQRPSEDAASPPARRFDRFSSTRPHPPCQEPAAADSPL